MFPASVYFMSNFFVSVYKAGGCEICGKPDYCSVADLEDGKKMYLCRRITEGAISIAKDGGGIFIREGNGIEIPKLKTHNNQVASWSTRFMVYDKMLSMLNLDTKEYLCLKERGLSNSEIQRLNYKSTCDIGQALYKKGYSLEHVPGFYFEDGKWKMNIVPGYFIPVLNRNGCIKALQIRTYFDKPKYVWFSSEDRKVNGEWIPLEFGASSGSPAHFRDSNNKDTTLWITESIIKADILWLRKNVKVGGAGGTKAGHDEFVKRCQEDDILNVNICFDMDWTYNTFVRDDIIRLHKKILDNSGICARIAIWDSTEGIDDAIKDGLEIKVIDYGKWISGI